MSEYFRAAIKKEHYGVHPSTIKFKSSLKNSIHEALRKRTWKETEDLDFDFYWSEKNFFSMETQQQIGHYTLAPHQRINHFPNNYELTRKDSMYKNLRKYKKQLEKEGRTEELKRFYYINIDLASILKHIICQMRLLYLWMNLKRIRMLCGL